MYLSAFLLKRKNLLPSGKVDKHGGLTGSLSVQNLKIKVIIYYYFRLSALI